MSSPCPCEKARSFNLPFGQLKNVSSWTMRLGSESASAAALPRKASTLGMRALISMFRAIDLARCRSGFPDVDAAAAGAQHYRLATAIDRSLQTTMLNLAHRSHGNFAMHTAPRGGGVQVKGGVVGHVQSHAAPGSFQSNLLG